MKILDCESRDATYESLGKILGVPKGSIDSLFQDTDLDHFYEKNPHYPLPADEYLFNLLRQLAPSEPTFDQVCWFHLTRASETNDFRDGILPLGDHIESIWGFLYGLLDGAISRREWDNFRHRMGERGNHYAFLYGMKVSERQHWGPYAILVRDIAFRAEEVRNHDYFLGPEIIEDICFCFSDFYSFDLLGEFRKRTKPCVVKFSDDRPGPDCLRAAVYYLYCAHWGTEMNHYCNTCFDGKGVAIPKSRILKIEFPNY